MISILGRLLMLVALGACATGAVAGFAAGARKSDEALRFARKMVWVFFLSVLSAVLVMEYALLNPDFSVSYVAEVGSHSLPTWVQVVSLWSSLNGSILLWAFVLASYTLGMQTYIGKRFPEYEPWALGTALSVAVFFCFLVSGVADPFEPTSQEKLSEMIALWGVGADGLPKDGSGPNPLLQNHILMVIHPPMLYLGYVGMSIPFAIACAGLFAGRLDASWGRVLRTWLLIPWGFLTVGIILGGWWSYEVLGWGGWWAWDPVENASFMPWLTATAAVHSIMLMRRRGHLKAWTIALVQATFLLTLLGTFMTRSAIFNSVQSFTESDVGKVFLVFLGLSLIASVVLMAARIDRLNFPEEGLKGPVSRDVAFLLNNLLFTAFTFTVLIGTVYPLLNEAITGKQISVGQPYFDAMTAPICAVIIFMMGVGPSLPWGRVTLRQGLNRVAIPLAFGGTALIGGLVAGMGGVLVIGMDEGSFILAVNWDELRNYWPLITLGLASFAFVVSLQKMAEPLLPHLGDRSKLWSALLQSRRRQGGYVVHIGVICIALAHSMATAYSTEESHTFEAGDSYTLEDESSGYTLVFLGRETVEESHRSSIIGHFELRQDGELVDYISPRLNHYIATGQAIGTPAVHSGLDEDLYLVLVNLGDDSTGLTVEILTKPLVWWLWFGGALMGLGCIISVLPVGSRRQSEASQEDVA